MIRSLCLTVLMLTLAACGGRPAPDLYVLRAPDTLDLACAGGLAVDRPTAQSEYNGKRIAVMLEGGRLTYYTGVAWASAFPEQLQGFMGEAFTPPEGKGRRLQLRVLAAEVTNPGAPVVRLKLAASVVGSGGTRRFTVTERVPAAENRTAAIVAAFNEAAEGAARTIARKLNRNCAI